MRKSYAIAGISGIVLLLMTALVFAYMSDNRQGSYGLAENIDKEVDMDRMHQSTVQSIDDIELKNQMNEMHETCEEYEEEYKNDYSNMQNRNMMGSNMMRMM